MENAKEKGWLWAAIGIVSFLTISWAAFAQQPGPPTASEQKIDWSAFLPAGEGKFQTAIYCASCHDLQPIVGNQRSDEAGWTRTVQEMAYTEGANIQDDDIPVISKYLARFFDPSTPKLEFPIHINKAPKQTLLLLGSLSEADVQKILDARTNEKVKDFATLAAMVGKDKVSKYESVIAFDDGSEKAK
jgi:hypothetical protein